MCYNIDYIMYKVDNSDNTKHTTEKKYVFK